MPADLLADGRGLLALALLLALPGWLVVRAPGTAVPFLSLSFWLTSWWWLSLVGTGRRRFLAATLVVFGILAAMRALRWRPSPPAGATLLVAAAALLRLVPFARWPVAPGAEASFHGLAASLMAAGDRVPGSYEPLAPIGGFGASPPGLHAFAADIALVAGIPIHRAACLATLAAAGLLQVGFYALLLRFLPPPVAAIGSVLALLASRAPTALAVGGGDGSVLALALVLGAVALLRRGGSPYPALAAGAILSGALVANGLLALAAAPFLVLAVRSPRAGPPAGERIALAALTALLVAVPFLPRVGAALSPGEAAGWLGEIGGLGLVLALACLAILVGAPGIARRLLASRRPAARLLMALLAGVALEGARRDVLARSPQGSPGPDDLEAMAWIAAQTTPRAVVCPEPGTAGAWIPAVAGRAIGSSPVPWPLRDELQAAGPPVCTHRYTRRPPTRSSPQVTVPSGLVVFENATVVVTTFDSPRGNLGRSPPVGWFVNGGSVGSRWGDGASAPLHCPRSGS